MKITKENQLASLVLFHSVVDNYNKNKVPSSILTKYGIIPISNQGMVREINSDLADLIIDCIGIKSSDWISSFHKNWDKVATAPIEQLMVEQILHYFSTYGLEACGLQSLNYIPVEKIFVDLDNAPSLEAFTVVRIIDEEELKEKIRDFILNVKSPHRDSIEHIRGLIPLVKDMDIDSIKSFEIRTIYCDVNNIVPSDGQDFLRYAIYKMSDGKITIIVKDKKTIESLKSFSCDKSIEQMFEKANLKKLSESFYRFKPLFLAFKRNKRLANKINKIRRYAVNNHKPVSGFAVSNLMNLLSQNRKEDAIKVIEKTDIRELVKLINFANYEVNARDHIYSIRNGKVFVKIEDEDRGENIIRRSNLSWLGIVCKDRLRVLLNNVYSGKVFYIPECVDYAVPVSEKQMLDTLPYGTRINLPKDAEAICIGGHWINQGRRIDLDFHLNSLTLSFGWNSGYRSSNNDILFSGDMTDAPAPNGAVEAFRISKSVKDCYLLSVNDYNTTGEVPFELLFTKDITSECEFKKDSQSMLSAVMDTENAIAPKINLKVHDKEEIIGFYYDRTFILYGGEIGGGHCIPKKKYMPSFVNAILERCKSMMTLKEFIELAGGKVIGTQQEKTESCIDLSIGNLTNKTIFELMGK